MSWKLRAPRAGFDFEHPAVYLVKDGAHLHAVSGTIQIWIGDDQPMHGRLLLAIDRGGIRVVWQKGYTQGDLHKITSALRNLGIPKQTIGKAFVPLYRELRNVAKRDPPE